MSVGFCLCGCGQPTSVIGKTNNLLGLVKGQYRRYAPGHNKLRHGASRKGKRTAEYIIWASMRQRCEDPNLDSYKNYGGRGVTVCERWQIFENFLADMGPRPTPNHMIERVNNDNGYSPDNCVWITSITEQNRNRRSVKLNTEAAKVIRFMLGIGVSQDLLAALYKVGQPTISMIGSGRIWA